MNYAGRTLGRYRVVAPIGSGGMGHVLRAYDAQLGREVAIKVLRLDNPNDPARAEDRARFLREGRAQARFRHPNAVTLFDVGEDGGEPFLVMELISGRSLREIIRTGGAPLADRIRWLTQVADALSAAHEAGLIHRDIKPENVMVDATSTARVLDFGLAKRLSEQEPAVTSLRHLAAPAPASFHTASGQVYGTPRYMAPEQAVGALVDGRADQFSWGRMAYELIAGQLPPMGAQAPRLVDAVPGISPFLSDIVGRAQSTLPNQRFASVAELLGELRRFTEPAAPPTGPATTRNAPPDTLMSAPPSAAYASVPPVPHPSYMPSQPTLQSAPSLRGVGAPPSPAPAASHGALIAILGALFVLLLLGGAGVLYALSRTANAGVIATADAAASPLVAPSSVHAADVGTSPTTPPHGTTARLHGTSGVDAGAHAPAGAAPSAAPTPVPAPAPTPTTPKFHAGVGHYADASGQNGFVLDRSAGTMAHAKLRVDGTAKVVGLTPEESNLQHDVILHDASGSNWLLVQHTGVTHYFPTEAADLIVHRDGDADPLP